MRKKRRAVAGVAAALSDGRRRFDEFRRTHRSRAPFTEDLWRQAGKLALEHGLNRTARALGVDYYALKDRRDAVEGRGQKADFVEFLPWGVSSGPECTIELEEQSGAKMRVRIKGVQLPDLAAITGAFRGGEPCSR